MPCSCTALSSQQRLVILRWSRIKPAPPSAGLGFSLGISRHDRVNRIFPHMPIPESLALEFLGTFARCEYALKSSGYAKGNANEVEANWDEFATDIEWHFQRLREAPFREAVNFLLTESPRKQVLKVGRLTWKDSPPDPQQRKSQQTLLMVRRIRNNLFHGAKVWSPEYDNRPRDIRLLEAGLTVLRKCIQLKDGVHMAFKHGVF